MPIIQVNIHRSQKIASINMYTNNTNVSVTILGVEDGSNYYASCTNFKFTSLKLTLMDIPEPDRAPSKIAHFSARAQQLKLNALAYTLNDKGRFLIA